MSIIPKLLLYILPMPMGVDFNWIDWKMFFFLTRDCTIHNIFFNLQNLIIVRCYPIGLYIAKWQRLKKILCIVQSLVKKKNIFQSIQLKSTPIGIGSIYSNNCVEYDYLILNEIKMMGKLTKIRGKYSPYFNTLPNYLKIVETSFILIPFNSVYYDFCDTGIFTLALHEYESGIRKNISLSIIEIEPVQDIICQPTTCSKFFDTDMIHSTCLIHVHSLLKCTVQNHNVIIISGDTKQSRLESTTRK
jgi:hypothetical protein